MLSVLTMPMTTPSAYRHACTTIHVSLLGTAVGVGFMSAMITVLSMVKTCTQASKTQQLHVHVYVRRQAEYNMHVPPRFLHFI